MPKSEVLSENSITAKMRQVHQPTVPIKTAEKITIAAYERVAKPQPTASSLKDVDTSKLKLKNRST